MPNINYNCIFPEHNVNFKQLLFGKAKGGGGAEKTRQLLSYIKMHVQVEVSQ